MKFCHALIAIAFFVVVRCLPSLANDSTATVGIGGITLEQNRDVVMMSEDLFVSLDQIVVKYVFKNTSAYDRKVTVAFPLPDALFKVDPADGQFAPDQFNFFTFVDNAPVKMSMEQKAILRGNDETATISRLKLPLDPNYAGDALSSASEVVKNEATNLGLLDENQNPAWSLRTTYYWTQVFPAHRDVTVEHRYKPSVGGTVETSIGAEWFDPHQSEYALSCAGDSFVQAVKRAANGLPPSDVFFESYISYILTTGGNWNGPIRQFHLVVDKGDPTTLVSFCGDGVVQRSPTQFEISAKNFVPEKELNVLLVRRKQVINVPESATGESLVGLSCDDLWLKRNTLFKSRGYCFHTQKAIKKFGNAGCQIDDESKIQLSADERDLVARIKLQEKAMRCSH